MIFNLETAIGPKQKVQDFESESLTIEVEHSQKEKATPSASDYGSKDCAFCPDPTVVSRFNISSRFELLTQRLFVEASAGTGKTYVIEHYLVRSILAAPFNPKKLALITFTKAVARELRLRLRTTLQATLMSVAEESVSSSSAPDYLMPILEQDALCRRRAARTIEEVVERLGEAMITTIHGFCDRLLRGWGEESGNGILEEWVGEEEKRKWLAEFLQEGAGFRGIELEVVSKKYFHDQKQLIDCLVKLMDDVEGKEDKAWEEAEKAVVEMREKSFGMKIFDALAAKAKSCRNNMRKDGTLHIEVTKALKAIQDIIENGITEERLEALCGFSLPKCYAVPLVKRTELTAEEEYLATIVLEDFWPALMELVDDECIVRRCAERSAKAFMGFVIASGKKTPDMVVRRVFELSTEKSFLAFAADAVEWLVVDEFQDTDAMQYAIFSRLFLENPLWHGHVLFVGDPKQAIYGFRKADVYSYLAAKKALLPHEIRTLAVNYRAERDVVEAQNRLFAGPEHPWIFYLPRAMTSLNVVPCDVGKEAQMPIGDGRGALHVFTAHHHLGRKRRWPHDEMEQQGLFPWLADEMICLESRGIPFRCQAILVKDRYQAKRVQQFLAERSIPTCAWRVDSVTGSPIYSWLQKAFSLAVRPNDPQRLSSLLLAIPSEYHLELCHAMASDRRLDQWAACAIAWSSVRDAFQEGGVASMARSLLMCRWNGRDTVEEWLRRMSHGDDMIIDLEHIFESLSLLDSVLPHSLEAYGDALSNIESHFSDDIETLIRRVDPDDEGAPVLTMHRSKGLEFDVVYALGCASRTKPPQDDIAVDEADAEKIRQLYVSITRAKRRCYLPLLIDDDEKNIPLGQASPVELLCAALSSQGDPSSAWTSTLYQSMSGASRLLIASRLSKDIPHAITMSDVAAEQRQLSCAKKLKTPASGTSLSKFSWLSRSYRSFTSEGSAPSTSAQRPQSQPHGALFGIRFHETIAQLLFAPPEARASVDSVAGWLKREEAYDVEMAQLLYDAVMVQLPLSDELVCLEDVPRVDIRAECSFLDREDTERYVVGVMDLVVLWKGSVYIIDWKTHEVEGGSCKDVVEQGYELQDTLYKQAVIRAFAPQFRYGGFFFIFVRHLGDGGVVSCFEK
jgi:exodeoxyribonuclease V beta subunit